MFGSPEFKVRSAYLLVSLGGCGEGNGFEAYSGSIDNDTNAWVDVSFFLHNGQLVISGTTATPRSLRDYAYTGTLDATTDLRLVARGNCKLSGNLGWKEGGADAWDADIYSVDSYSAAPSLR